MAVLLCGHPRPHNGETADPRARSRAVDRPLHGCIVNHMVNYSPARLDAVFGALADPTRRAVLGALRDGEQSVGTLAPAFDMSLPGFIKHLAILEHAGLIERRKTGRVVHCRLTAAALKEASDWLDRYEDFWNARLDRLEALLTRKEQERWKPQSTTKPASRSGASSKRLSPPSMRRGRTPRK
jgi:DNA-binding transcriptional ArsR family regulator